MRTTMTVVINTACDHSAQRSATCPFESRYFEVITADEKLRWFATDKVFQQIDRATIGNFLTISAHVSDKKCLQRVKILKDHGRIKSNPTTWAFPTDFEIRNLIQKES
jgi:hypothetical protein